MMTSMCRPITSAAVYPKIRSAPGFHDWMTPFRFLLTIASSEASTMAASRDCVSYALFRSLISIGTGAKEPILEHHADHARRRCSAHGRRVVTDVVAWFY